MRAQSLAAAHRADAALEYGRRASRVAMRGRAAVREPRRSLATEARTHFATVWPRDAEAPRDLGLGEAGGDLPHQL